MTNDIEIGTSTKLELGQEYLLHIEAEPLKFARFLQQVLKEVPDSEKGGTMSQRGLAKYLRGIGYKINQPQVHRHLSMLTLEPHFIKMIEESRMAFITSYKLSRMDEERRAEVLTLASSELEKEDDVVKIFQRHLDEIKRRNLNSDDIFEMLMKQSDFKGEYSSVDDRLSEPIRAIQSESTPLIAESELKSLVTQLKMRAKEGRISPKEVEMYVMQSTPVLDVIKAVSKAIGNKVKEDNPENPTKEDTVYKVY